MASRRDSIARAYPWLGPVSSGVVPVAAVLFLLAGPVLGGSVDEEEYRNAILTLVLHARALADGVYPFWTSDLGFGLPHPLHPAMLLHPVVPLFAALSPDTAVAILHIGHAVLGALGCWCLVRQLGAGPWIAGVASATWTLATPSQNYLLVDFWPAEFVVWSLAPWLLLCLLRVLDAPGSAQPWRRALAFGIVSGLVAANGHAGYVPVFFATLAVTCAVDWRRTWRVLPALALATVVGAAIAAPTLVHLLAELRRFPTLARETADRAIGAREILDMVLRPLPVGSSAGMADTIVERGARVPFFGGPMFLLALAFAAGLRDVRRTGLLAGFAAAFVLMTASALGRYELLSAMSMFRDPMTIYGIALGSLAWQALARRHRPIAVAAGVIQIGVLAASAWPFVSDTWAAGEAEHTFLHDTAIAADLRARAASLPGRWYVAPALDERIRQGWLEPDGLWRDAWVYRGLPVVNGTFKGVSADPMYPSSVLPLGHIEGHPATASSTATLSVLGLGAVLATGDEPVASGLQEVARYEVTGGEMRLLRNIGVWPGAAFVDGDILDTTPPALPGCDLDGVLCLDLSAVHAASRDASVNVARRHGVIDAVFEPAPEPRWLLVSEMYRRQWQARAGGDEATVRSVFGGLIAVAVPPGATAVELRYRPLPLVAATWLSWIALAVSAVACLRPMRNAPILAAGGPAKQARPTHCARPGRVPPP